MIANSVVRPMALWRIQSIILLIIALDARMSLDRSVNDARALGFVTSFKRQLLGGLLLRGPLLGGPLSRGPPWRRANKSTSRNEVPGV